MSYKEIKILENQYNANEIEKRCADFWEKENVYSYNVQASREESFIIDTPPPTVSGALHIGHIFSYTQTDVIARFQRMNGKSVFYPIGWDDNGLPTERRVQNYFNIACNPALPYDPNFKPTHNPDDKSPRHEVSRKNFVEACELLTAEDERVFDDIFHNIGHSYDWKLKYATIASEAIQLAQKSFIDLFEKGKVQSVEAPTMWDVTFQSAIAQAEIEDREVEGHFHDLKFKVADSDASFIISTTRPELLPACLAIVAHPDDERYQPFFGKKAIVPLFDALVPIVPSEHAEIGKGTGIMMVCTFGDAADVAWWKKSGLPIKQIIGRDGRILDVHYGEGAFTSLNPTKAYQNYQQLIGLTTKQAKEKIVELLLLDGALQGEPRKIMHPVKFYEKGNLPLEFVSSRQWFVKLLDEKQRMIDAGRQIKWQPSHMLYRFEEWAEGLNQDWCISRQRFFGVPFPVWYPLNSEGQSDYTKPLFAKKEKLPVDPMTDAPDGYTESQRGQPNGFIGDQDVMDTWATSSLTPQIAMNTLKVKNNVSLPFDVRAQAHDIIRTWAFYTIAKALLHENKIPWKEALISGFILDPDRKKMSKSKGNVVTPQHLIDKHSADGVRYWAAKARLGIDTAFDENVMEQGRKLAMKIFNASKFVLNIVSSSSLSCEDNYIKYIDKKLDKAWISKLKETVYLASKAFQQNDYGMALENIESRFWDFCDNYLEIVKKRAYSEDNQSSVATLMFTIDFFMRLFAPFCPFITEEVFQCCPWQKTNKSLHAMHWPMMKEFENMGLTQDVLYDTLVSIVSEIRKAKTTNNKTQKTPVNSLEIIADDDTIASLKKAEQDLENVGNVKQGGIIYQQGKTLLVQNIILDMNYLPSPKNKG